MFGIVSKDEISRTILLIIIMNKCKDSSITIHGTNLQNQIKWMTADEENVEKVFDWSWTPQKKKQ